MGKHGSPSGPIVVKLWPPNIQLVRNAFTVQYPRKLVRCLWIFVIATTSQYVNMPAVPNLLQVPFIVQVWDIVAG